MAVLDDLEEEQQRLLEETSSSAPPEDDVAAAAPLPPEAALAKAFETAQVEPKYEPVQEAPAPTPAPAKSPAQERMDQLIAAIREPRPVDEGARAKAQMGQAFYAAGIRSKLPDSFFAPDDGGAEKQARLNLLRAQIAKSLAGTLPKAAVAGGVGEQESPEAVHALIDSYPEERMTDTQRAAMHQLADSNPKAARQLLEKPTSVTGNVAQQKRLGSQFEEGLGFRKGQAEISHAETAQKSAEKAAAVMGKDAVSMISAADTIDKVTKGALSSPAFAPSPELEQALSAPHRLNIYAKRIPGFVESIPGKMQELYEKYIAGGATPEQAHAEVAKDPNYNLGAIDSALALFYLTKQHELAGSAVTGNERNFVKDLFNRQMGASPVEQLVGLRVMLKALDANVQSAYGPMKAAGEMNPAVKKMYEGLQKAGSLTPEHPLLQKMRGQFGGAPAPAAVPEGYRKVTLKDGRRGFLNPITQDFIEGQ